jgi:hypothetical protein
MGSGSIASPLGYLGDLIFVQTHCNDILLLIVADVRSGHINHLA